MNTLSDNAARRWRLAGFVLVSLVAAVMSYRHIAHLALTHGQDSADAHLLPISVDGAVAAASFSVVLAGHKGKADWVASLMLWLACLATLGANVAAGWSAGPIGWLSSGWPAVAFIGSAEMVFRDIRRNRRPAKAGKTLAEPADTGARHAGRARPASAPRPGTDTEAAALRVLSAKPNLSGRELAELLGTSDRTGRRLITRLRPAEAPAESNGAAVV